MLAICEHMTLWLGISTITFTVIYLKTGDIVAATYCALLCGTVKFLYAAVHRNCFSVLRKARANSSAVAGCAKRTKDESSGSPMPSPVVSLFGDAVGHDRTNALVTNDWLGKDGWTKGVEVPS